MTPANFLTTVVDPGLALLARIAGVPSNDRARVLLVAIAGQESGWNARVQHLGPGHSWWQFERAGGAAGVLTHPASRLKIRAVCAELVIPADLNTVYETMVWNDNLAVAMARLLLWTDVALLPPVGNASDSWLLYLKLWRPGKPRAADWPANYAVSAAAVAKMPTREPSKDYTF